MHQTNKIQTQRTQNKTVLSK